MVRDDDGFKLPLNQAERRELHKRRLVEQATRVHGGELWQDALRELEAYENYLRRRYIGE